MRRVICKNKKTGKEYDIVAINVINATNAHDGQKMVLYTDMVNMYVREGKEFYEKFEVVHNVQ